ncbi:MAG: hypothetical protein GY854_23505, partial [Deltaproteobacteria bacterium]|nr:hypothetical protein [Deltaproteobacteria bacterium]
MDDSAAYLNARTVFQDGGMVDTSRDVRSDVDSYYADIPDIPMFRDETEGFRSTRGQISRLQHPTRLGLVGDPAVYADRFFNNSPYLQDYNEDGTPRRDLSGRLLVTDTSRDAKSVPGASVLDLWAGEMRALSDKEMSGDLSPREEELLRAYQDYFTGRTGFQDGGMVGSGSILDLPTDQFLSALDELGLPDDQREFLLSQYAAPEPRPMVDSILDFLGYFSPEAINARAEAAGNADYRTTAPGRPLPFFGNDGSSEPLSVRVMRDAQDFVPVLGDVIAVGDAADALSEGRRTEAALLGGAAMLGLIPGVGDVLARPITAAARRNADKFLSQYPSDDLGYFHSAYAPSRTHMIQMAQKSINQSNPGFQLNPEEVSYLNRVDEAHNLRDAGATNREIFEQTNIMLVPQRDADGNIIDEVALTAIPRSGSMPTHLATDAREIVEKSSYDPRVGEVADFGSDIRGLFPSGGPRSIVVSEDIPGDVTGEFRQKLFVPDEVAVSPRLSDEEFLRTLAHEAEHALQSYSGLLPQARGSSSASIPGGLTDSERFAMYEANLGELLARRAEGDAETRVPAGIMQLLNPYIRTNRSLTRPLASVPANIFE